ncbi:hypothetical protein CI102_13432, partial [Trichoderma harzianum]
EFWKSYVFLLLTTIAGYYIILCPNLLYKKAWCRKNKALHTSRQKVTFLELKSSDPVT